MLGNSIQISRPKTKAGPPSQRFRAVTDILVGFTPLLVLGMAGTFLGGGTAMGGLLITLGYLLSIAVGTGVLKARGTGWRQIGMGRPKSWRRTFILGLGTMIASIVLMVAFETIVFNLPGVEVAPADQSRFDPVNGNILLLAVYLIATWTSVAFGEEMLFRAFLIDRLTRFFQGPRTRSAFALLGSSAFFGLVHFYAGPIGIVETGLVGLLIGFVYLRTGRNLWVTIVAHGLIDTLRFVMFFAGA